MQSFNGSLGLSPGTFPVTGSFGFASTTSKDSTFDARARYAPTNDASKTLSDQLSELSLELEGQPVSAAQIAKAVDKLAKKIQSEVTNKGFRICPTDKPNSGSNPSVSDVLGQLQKGLSYRPEASSKTASGISAPPSRPAYFTGPVHIKLTGPANRLDDGSIVFANDGKYTVEITTELAVGDPFGIYHSEKDPKDQA